MSKKNKEVTKSEKDYYKLNTKAVDRLASVNISNARKVSDKELSKYNKSKLANIPPWIKASFVKFWFAGACCFFIYWGLGTYVTVQLDLLFILGLTLGVVNNLLVNNVLRYMAYPEDQYNKFMMNPSKKYIFFIADIFYSMICLFIVYLIYSFVNGVLFRGESILGVEPILFGLLYAFVDMSIVKIKNIILNKIKGSK